MSGERLDDWEDPTFEPGGEGNEQDAPADLDEPEPEPEPRSPTAEARVCQVDGCDNLIPADAHGARKFCFEHWTGAPRGEPKKRGRPRKTPPVDQPDPNKLGGPVKRATRPAELAVVEANAKRLLEGGAALIVLGSRQTQEPLRSMLVADAVDVQRGADPLAHAVRGVAAHEEWLRKILGGGGPISDRAVAWIGLGVCVISVSLPIWIRHGLLPAEISQMAENLIQAPPGGPPPDQPAEPTPAAAA